MRILLMFKSCEYKKSTLLIIKKKTNPKFLAHCITLLYYAFVSVFYWLIIETCFLFKKKEEEINPSSNRLRI